MARLAVAREIGASTAAVAPIERAIGLPALRQLKHNAAGVCFVSREIHQGLLLSRKQIDEADIGVERSVPGI